jgi:hypothetical protein
MDGLDGPLQPEHVGIMALVNPERLRRILTKMLDENEFLGPHESALADDLLVEEQAIALGGATAQHKWARKPRE